MKYIYVAIALFVYISATSGVEAIMPTPTDILTDARFKSLEYALPHPGMLPDHPFYALKTFRDVIMETLIADKLKKADFFLLQSDKHIQMSEALSSEEKWVLSIRILEKGENFADRALSSLIGLQKKGKEVPAYLTEKLEHSANKHAQIVAELTARAPQTYTSQYERIRERILERIDKVNDLK